MTLYLFLILLIDIHLWSWVFTEVFQINNLAQGECSTCKLNPLSPSYQLLIVTLHCVFVCSELPCEYAASQHTHVFLVFSEQQCLEFKICTCAWVSLSHFVCAFLCGSVMASWQGSYFLFQVIIGIVFNTGKFTHWHNVSICSHWPSMCN